CYVASWASPVAKVSTTSNRRDRELPYCNTDRQWLQIRTIRSTARKYKIIPLPGATGRDPSRLGVPFGHRTPTAAALTAPTDINGDKQGIAHDTWSIMISWNIQRPGTSEKF